MKEVDIEGIKIQFKSMTMFTWSTTKVKNWLLMNKNETYYKYKYPEHTFSAQKK